MASIEQAYETLFTERASGQIARRQEAAREHALTYDHDLVFRTYWEPAIERLAARCKPGCMLKFAHVRPGQCQVASKPLCPVCHVPGHGSEVHKATDVRR